MPPVTVSRASLHVAARRLPLGEYFLAIWARRHFIHADSKARAFKVGSGTFLGRAWIIVDPLLQVAIYSLVFGVMLRVDRGIDNFIGFLILGVIVFGFFSKGINGAAGILDKYRNLLDAFTFPAVCALLSSISRQMMENLVPMFLSLVVATLAQPDKGISVWAVLVIPLYFLAHLFILGATLIVARAVDRIPDLRNVVNVCMRCLFFLSGIFYPISRFDSHPVLHDLMVLNPIYQFLNSFRLVVLDGKPPTDFTMTYLLSWTVGLLIFGGLYFWRGEGSYGRR